MHDCEEAVPGDPAQQTAGFSAEHHKQDRETMDIPDTLRDIAKNVRSGETPRLTVRTLLGYFGAARRRRRVVARIREALLATGLETFPDFEGEWFDNEIFLVQRGCAPVSAASPEVTTRVPDEPDPGPIATPPTDPTRRLGRLKEFKERPVSVTPDDPLEKATTLMLTHDFSQLPVMTSDHEVKGVVSWKTIGSRLVLGEECPFVRECMEPPQELSIDSSIFDAIRIIAEHDFVLVRNRVQKIVGIVTASDINIQFHQLAEPFLLLSDIENQLRSLIEQKFSGDDIQTAKDPNDESRMIKTVSDLTFGEYLRLLENEENWKKLELQLHRKTFIGYLEEIRQIRNDVMHFEPDGIDEEQLDKLRSFAKCLTRLDEVTRV